jgi:hypothetical protein
MFPFKKLEAALEDISKARDKGVVLPDSVQTIERFIYVFGPVKWIGDDGHLPTLGQVLAQTYAAWRVSVLAKGLDDPGEYVAPPGLA